MFICISLLDITLGNLLISIQFKLCVTYMQGPIYVWANRDNKYIPRVAECRDYNRNVIVYSFNPYLLLRGQIGSIKQHSVQLVYRFGVSDWKKGFVRDSWTLFLSLSE